MMNKKEIYLNPLEMFGLYKSLLGESLFERILDIACEKVCMDFSKITFAGGVHYANRMSEEE